MTIDELRSAAAVVRDATEEGENTALRLGQLFLSLIDEVEAGQLAANDSPNNAFVTVDSMRVLLNFKRNGSVLFSIQVPSATAGQAGVMTPNNYQDLFNTKQKANNHEGQLSALQITMAGKADASALVSQLKSDLYTAFGAVWDSSTQRWSLNGLTDITDAQMDDIFVESHDFRISQTWDGRFRGTKARTNLFPYKPKNSTVVWSANISKLYTSAVGMFAYADMETIVLTQDLANMSNGITFAPRVTDARDMFNNAKNLKKVFGVILMDAITDAANVSGMFTRADALEEISLAGLRVGLTFAACPSLKPATVAFICNNCNKLVNNAYPALSLTLTLHATAFDAAVASSDVTAALANAYDNRNATVTLTDGTRTFTHNDI